MGGYLVLKDGRVLQGTFKSGLEKSLQFEVDRKVETIALNDITTLTFSPRASQKTVTEPPAPPAAAGAAVAENAAGPLTVPAGTKLLVKPDKNISTASNTTGSIISGVLDIDLVVREKVVAPKGSQLCGKVLESVEGKRIGIQRIVIQFTDLMINNQKMPIQTLALGAEGGRGGAVKTVGTGALICAAAGDAGKGTLVGAGISLLAGEVHNQIPAGTLA